MKLSDRELLVSCLQLRALMIQKKRNSKINLTIYCFNFFIYLFFIHYSYAIKKLYAPVNKKEFIQNKNYREFKILYDLNSDGKLSPYVIKYVDCFFDQDNYVYLVTKFYQVIKLN